MGRSKSKPTPRATKKSSGGKTTQRWIQTKQGITYKTQAKLDNMPNPRARWIEVMAMSKHHIKCSILSFRDAWTPDYRRDAVWVQIALDISSNLGENINAFTGAQPIGFHLSKKATKDGDQSVSLSELFPDTDASWLSDVTALIAQDLVTVEVHAVDSNGEPQTLLQPTSRRHDASQPKFALSVGLAWQRYMDLCLYKPGFAWPPTELLHVQMQRTMLWVLRASRPLPNQWSFRDHDELDRLFDEFVCCSPNAIGDREELEPPSESTCVEFERSGISLGYDPYRACFLGLL